MILAATRNGWNAPDDATDDQADAWWLYTIGSAAQNHWIIPQTAYRTALIADIDTFLVAA